MEIMFHEEFGFVWSSTFLSWHFCMSHIGEASILFPVPLSASFFSALDPFIGTKDEVRAKNIKLQRHSWFKVEQERDSSVGNHGSFCLHPPLLSSITREKEEFEMRFGISAHFKDFFKTSFCLCFGSHLKQTSLLKVSVICVALPSCPWTEA